MAKKKRKPSKQKQEMTIMETLFSWVKTILGAIIVVMILNGLLVASFVVPTGSMEKTVMAGDFLFVNKFIYGPSTPQVIPFFDIPLPYYQFPGIAEPEKGDVIVFIYPGDRDKTEADKFQYYLKRCVATPGDKLEIRDNVIYVNDKMLEVPEHVNFTGFNPPYEKRSTFPRGRGFSKSDYGPIRIPKKGDTIKLSSKNIQEWDIFIRREGHEVNYIGNNIRIDGKETDRYVVERNYVFGIGDNRDMSQDSRFWGFIPEENVVGTPMIVYWSWDPDYSLLGDFGKKIASIRWSRIGTIID